MFLLAASAMADAILWMVDDNFYNGSYQAARVMYTYDKEVEGQPLPVTFFDEDEYGYTLKYDDGIGLINTDYNLGTTGQMWSLIPDDLKADKENVYYYIELGTVEDVDADELVWKKTITTGDYFTYDELCNDRSNPDHTPHQYEDGSSKEWYSIGLSNDGSMPVNVFMAWDGKPYVESSLAAAIDIRLYEANGGVIAEFQTLDENAEEGDDNATIDIYVKVDELTAFLDGYDIRAADGMYKLAGRVKAVGHGDNLYKINVDGMVSGGLYSILIHDEEGRWHKVNNAKVERFAMDMTRMSPEGLELKWTSIPGRTYKVMYAESLVGPWTEIARVDAEENSSATTYFAWYKNLGPSVTRFFKTVMVDEEKTAARMEYIPQFRHA